MYSYMELAEKVQASDTEIKEYLKKINAFEFRGYWRIFDEEYRIEVLKNIMCKLMEKDWPDVKVRLVSQEFPEIPYEILLALLKTIGSVDRDTFTVDKLKVYQMCACDLFISNNEYLKEEFETAFKNLTNMVVYRKYINTLLTIEEILEGIAIYRIKNYCSSFKYLNKYQITYNLEERLNLLFSIKPRWTEKELRVYLSDVSIITLPQLLLRHTKKVIEGSAVLYTSKLN